MTARVTRRTFALGAAAIASAGITLRRARAADAIKLRISLDTAPSHMRNVSILDYCAKLEKASEGRIKTEVFHAGALFSDLNVTKVLVQGQVEMACPGTWTLTGFVPDFDFPNLPMLYGLPLAQVRKIVDGKTGALCAATMLKKLKIRVIGPWLELGSQNWYTAKPPIRTFADLKGLKIRNAGGAALGVRARFFEAIPNTTAWPDVPLALSQGTFDGLISTNESCFSAKLWEAGLKYSIQDHQNINEYVPLISDGFYSGLAADLQKMISGIWADNITTYRENMGAAQERALTELKNHGVQITVPDQAEITAIRNRMLPDQDKLVKDLKMDPDIGKMIAADMAAGA
jgi:C4-dicarboxylate-binding protein DctP